MSKRKPDELQSIRDDSAHRYFHQMLNMTDDDLNPYQYRLLGHYLRWAGHGGKHPEGLRETAKITHMGINKVRSTRQELVNLGYLEVKEASDEDIKNGIPSVVTVLDRWQENINRYAKPRIQSDTAPVSNPIQVSTETRIDLDTAPVSKVTHSEELREEPKKEEQQTPPKGDNPAIAAIIKAWIETNNVIDPKAYGKKGYRDYAAAMHKEGITPDDVIAYIFKEKAGKFYADKAVPLSVVAQNIKTFKNKTHQRPAPAASDEPTPEQVAAMPDMTPDDLAILAKLNEKFSGKVPA